MGNNNLDLKMFISATIWLIIVYFIVNIFNLSQNTINIMMGSAIVYIYISGIYFSHQIYTPQLFKEYDKKYKLKYGKKILLSKNDKYILKQICYTVHNGKYHESVINAILEKDNTEIDNFLLRNKWKLDNRDSFNNVINLLSEYLLSKI